jgi:hypothetical protein
MPIVEHPVRLDVAAFRRTLSSISSGSGCALVASFPDTGHELIPRPSPQVVRGKIAYSPVSWGIVVGISFVACNTLAVQDIGGLDFGHQNQIAKHLLVYISIGILEVLYNSLQQIDKRTKPMSRFPIVCFCVKVLEKLSQKPLGSANILVGLPSLGSHDYTTQASYYVVSGSLMV